jgi:hypothetical protein
MSSSQPSRVEYINGLLKYEYSDLSKPELVRRLQLVPLPEIDRTIYYELKEVPFEDSPDDSAGGYKAVTWEWGTGAKTETLRIYEHERAYAFPVSEHLYECLLALRLQNKARYL